MMPALAGLWPPVATPFRADGAVDTRDWSSTAARCLPMAPTGSPSSVRRAKRIHSPSTSAGGSLTRMSRRGIEAARLIPGTGACAIEDAVALTRHAGEIGAAAVLLLPPFYYKKVTDDGLFNFVSAVIERSGSRIPRILLYHIPPMASIGWSVDLVGRLRDAYPDVIVGMKDSSGDFEHTKRMIEAFPRFAVFPGAEIYVLKAMQAGAVGCISASANINAFGIRHLLDRWQTAEAEALQAELNEVRKAVESRVMIPSLKAILAARYNDPGWLAVRPPLIKISDALRGELLAEPAIVRLLVAVPA